MKESGGRNYHRRHNNVGIEIISFIPDSFILGIKEGCGLRFFFFFLHPRVVVLEIKHLNLIPYSIIPIKVKAQEVKTSTHKGLCNVAREVCVTEVGRAGEHMIPTCFSTFPDCSTSVRLQSLSCPNKCFGWESCMLLRAKLGVTLQKNRAANSRVPSEKNTH